MGKALVIKGSNFSVNKVTTVTLDSNPIPCTAISITPSTLAFNTIGETATIVPTLTPADTTDVVSYASSNTDVATVSSSGVVIIIGIGTATITATCGTKSATCSVTVSDVVVTPINYIVGYCAPGEGYSASFESSVLNRFTGVGSISDGSVTNAEVVDTRTASLFYIKETMAIPIPKGATKVHCHQVGAPTYGTIRCAFYDGTTAGNQTYPSMLKSIGSSSVTLSTSEVDVDIPSGATKLTFAMNIGGSYTIDQDANALAEAIELAITFN